MRSHVRLRVLLAAAVAVICGSVFAVASLQERADSRSFARYLATQQLRSAAMRMALTIGDAVNRGPAADDEVRPAQREIASAVALLRRWPGALVAAQTAAASRLARLGDAALEVPHGAPGAPPPDIDAPRRVMDGRRDALASFLAANDAVLVRMAADRRATQRAGARRPVLLVGALCLIFGLAHLLLFERPAKRERERRRAHQAYMRALQVARSADEAQAILCTRVVDLVGAEGAVVGRTGGVALIASGRTVGGLRVQRRRPLSDAERELIEQAAAEAAPVIANLRTLALAEHRAATDALTGLPNQGTVHAELRRAAAQAGRSTTSIALVLFDLDHFKAINDTFGHAKGDEVLAAVGAVVPTAIRASDFAGRFGGEEFALILPGTGRSGAAEVAEKVRAAIAAIEVDGIDRRLSASFGVAVLPEDAGEPGALFRAADRALYEAKRAGRDRVALAA